MNPINSYMKILGMKTKHLVLLSGLSIDTLHQYCQDARKPTKKSGMKIDEAFNLPKGTICREFEEYFGVLRENLKRSYSNINKE